MNDIVKCEKPRNSPELFRRPNFSSPRPNDVGRIPLKVNRFARIQVDFAVIGRGGSNFCSKIPLGNIRESLEKPETMTKRVNVSDQNTRRELL